MKVFLCWINFTQELPKTSFACSRNTLGNPRLRVVLIYSLVSPDVPQYFDWKFKRSWIRLWCSFWRWEQNKYRLVALRKTQQTWFVWFPCTQESKDQYAEKVLPEHLANHHCRTKCRRKKKLAAPSWSWCALWWKGGWNSVMKHVFL